MLGCLTSNDAPGLTGRQPGHEKNIYYNFVKLGYSEKATKFEKISSDHANFFQQPSHQILGI